MGKSEDLPSIQKKLLCFRAKGVELIQNLSIVLSCNQPHASQTAQNVDELNLV